MIVHNLLFIIQRDEIRSLAVIEVSLDLCTLLFHSIEINMCVRVKDREIISLL